MHVGTVIIILCQLSHVIVQCEPFIIQIFMMSTRLIVALFPGPGGAWELNEARPVFTTGENSTCTILSSMMIKNYIAVTVTIYT